jgi:hypothetical protein
VDKHKAIYLRAEVNRVYDFARIDGIRETWAAA